MSLGTNSKAMLSGCAPGGDSLGEFTKEELRKSKNGLIVYSKKEGP